MGRYKAEDMQFIHLWNCDSYEPQKRNYSMRKMIFRTPNYKSWGDENGGYDNSRDESIGLTVNVEEGKVFLEEITQAKKIFENDEEIDCFVQCAQKLFDEKLDMGKGTSFLFGWGGSYPTLWEHVNPNIQYLKIYFPDDEKFNHPKYRQKVVDTLIEKGAIFITPQNGKAYLAVIQRKDRPRDLSPFMRYLQQTGKEVFIFEPKYYF